MKCNFTKSNQKNAYRHRRKSSIIIILSFSIISHPSIQQEQILTTDFPRDYQPTSPKPTLHMQFQRAPTTLSLDKVDTPCSVLVTRQSVTCQALPHSVACQSEIPRVWLHKTLQTWSHWRWFTLKSPSQLSPPKHSSMYRDTSHKQWRIDTTMEDESSVLDGKAGAGVAFTQTFVESVFKRKSWRNTA